MQKNRKTLHWKTKRYIIQVVCSIVLIVTMGISLLGQSSNEKDTLVSEESCKTGRQIEETEAFTKLYMENAVVESGITAVEKRERIEDVSTESDPKKVVAVKKDEMESVKTFTKEHVVADDKASVTKENSKLATRKEGRSGNGNKVVKNVSKQSESTVNRVEKNPEPLYLIERIFENHGTAPQMSDIVQKYQYPIEIGYALDRNYDGKNSAGDLILNKVYDTEAVTEDFEDEDYASEEDSVKVSGDTSEETDSAETTGDGVEETDSTEAIGDSVEETDSTETLDDSNSEVISGDVPGSKEVETKQLETYRKSVWKKIFSTEAEDVEVKEKQGNIVETEATADVSETSGEIMDAASDKVENPTSEMAEEVSGDVVERTSEEISGDAGEQMSEEELSDRSAEVVEKEISTGYYIIKGKMRKDTDVFVSDIEIIPEGIDGFDQVRIGEDGEFAEFLIITEDAVDKEIKLYFTDGEQVTEATTFTYSKDTVIPELQLVQEELQTLQSSDRTIYCTKESKLSLAIHDGDVNIKDSLSKVQYLYGDQMKVVEDGWDEPKITIEDDFYGRLLLNCKDKAGNVSNLESQFVLIDHNQPEIVIAQDKRCSAPYTLWVTASEAGHIVSGIRSVRCVVNGEMYDVTDAVVNETYTLDEGLEVSSKLTFPIELTEVGIHAISILVRDYAGNETVVEQTIEVTEPELVSIYMPRNFTIHIDPQQLAGKEQIYSDNVELKNVSKFDVRVNIDNIVLNVNDEVSADGVLKDCEIYLIAPDTGEKIKLSKGENEDVYSYCLPVDAVGDLANIRFVGTTTEGSAGMWKGSDISLSLQVSFIKWEVEEPE